MHFSKWENELKLVSLHWVTFNVSIPDKKSLHKTFWGTTKKCENKNLSYFYLNATFWNTQDGKG